MRYEHTRPDPREILLSRKGTTRPPVLLHSPKETVDPVTLFETYKSFVYSGVQPLIVFNFRGDGRRQGTLIDTDVLVVTFL